MTEKSYRSLYDLIDRITETPPNNLEGTEHLLGIKLNLSSENVFRRYEANDININSIPIKFLDYREPPRKKNGENGPFIEFTVEGICLRRDHILSHFKNLRSLGISSGSSPAREIYYYRESEWGKLGFGFSEQSPSCLKNFNLIFKGKSVLND